MNWKYIKSFLIILLIFVDILLCKYSYDSYRARGFTDRKTAADAVHVLAGSGITVDADLLSVQVDRAPKRRCVYTREDYDRLVLDLLFDTEPDGIFLLPDGLLARTAAGDTATLTHDFSLLYTAAGRDAGLIEAAYAKADAAKADTSAARQALAALLALPEARADKLTATTADGYLFFTVTGSAGDLPLSFGDCIFAYLGGKLVYARGSYLFLATEAEDAEPLLTRVNILLSERRRGKTGTVTAVSLCYAPYEDTAEGILLLMPAYRVTYADGSVSVVNALSGEKY